MSRFVDVKIVNGSIDFNRVGQHGSGLFFSFGTQECIWGQMLQQMPPYTNHFTAAYMVIQQNLYCFCFVFFYNSHGPKVQQLLDVTHELHVLKLFKVVTFIFYVQIMSYVVVLYMITLHIYLYSTFHTIMQPKVLHYVKLKQNRSINK